MLKIKVEKVQKKEEKTKRKLSSVLPLLSCCSVSESVGDRQQLVGLLHGLDFGVRLVVHGLVAPAGVIQKLLLRRLELTDLRHLQEIRLLT